MFRIHVPLHMFHFKSCSELAYIVWSNRLFPPSEWDYQGSLFQYCSHTHFSQLQIQHPCHHHA